MKVIKKIELTEVQKGIYFDCKIDSSASYNIFLALQLENLNERKFEQALQLLLIEQEVLRSAVIIENDFPVLVIYDHNNLTINYDNMLFTDNWEDLCQNLLHKEIQNVIEINDAQLFRISLTKLPNNKHIFVFIIHHIICDGISLDIFKNKLLYYYQQLVKKEPITFKKNHGFSQYMLAENIKLRENKYLKQKEFWKQKMASFEPKVLHRDYTVIKKLVVLALKRISLFLKIYLKK